MIIVLKPSADDEQLGVLEDIVRQSGCKPIALHGEERRVIAVIGDAAHVARIDKDNLTALPYVDQVRLISKPYKLVSREGRQNSSIIRVNGASIGDNNLVIIAGPCAVESRDSIIKTSQELKGIAHGLRGGAFKPRTDPYSFQGLGEEGLKYLAEAGSLSNLFTVTEVMGPGKVELVSRYADVLQIGARSMKNYDLLKAVGQSKKPVLLKRGEAADLEEFLLAAEYIMSEGNSQVMLCVRGLKGGFDGQGNGKSLGYRNTPDIAVIPVLKRETHLPVLADPSHMAGKREFVESLALQAVMAGADGLLIECHYDPTIAKCDASQTISSATLQKIVQNASNIREIYLKTV